MSDRLENVALCDTEVGQSNAKTTVGSLTHQRTVLPFGYAPFIERHFTELYEKKQKDSVGCRRVIVVGDTATTYEWNIYCLGVYNNV